MHYKWMHAHRVFANMVCSASGGPLSAILWGEITAWGSHKWTDGRFWGTDARPGRPELRGSGLLAAGGIQGGGNHTPLPEFLRGNRVHFWVSLPFSPSTHLQFSEGTAGASPGGPGARIVLTFFSTTTAGWLLWLEGVYGDPVNWCTKQPIKR